MSKFSGESAARTNIASFAKSAYERYASHLQRYLGRRMRRSQDIEDVAQEVYLRLTRVEAEKEIKEPLAFMYVVAANVLNDYLSAARLESEHVSSAGDVWETGLNYASESQLDQPDENLNFDQQIAQAEQALAELPKTHQAVLLMLQRDGMTREAVAAELGISPHTVKKYLTEARAKLRLRVWK
jgi:RNA polymerase sigma-70 factor (ECF subfamily)